MPVRRIDDHQIDVGIDQPLAALETGIADAGGRGNAQAALLVLGRVRIEPALLDVLDRDQADAAVVLVDDQQFLDAMLVEQPLGLVRSDRSRRR